MIKFTETDEWYNYETKETGLTVNATSQLGTVVYADFMISKGDYLLEGEPALTVETVKNASDIYAPISGYITEINEELIENPELIDSTTWLYKIVEEEVVQKE